MRYGRVVAALAAAQLVAAVTAHSEQSLGKWKLNKPADNPPTARLEFPSYAGIASLDMVCTGGLVVNIKVNFRNAAQRTLKIAGSTDGPASTLSLGADGILMPSSAVLFDKIVRGAEQAGEQLRIQYPSAPVRIDVVIGDSDVEIEGYTPATFAVSKECQSYFNAKIGGQTSEPRLNGNSDKGWILPRGNLVANYNIRGEYVAIQALTKAQFRGVYKTDGNTLWLDPGPSQMKCGYRFDNNDNLVLSNCGWAGTWVAADKYQNGR